MSTYHGIAAINCRVCDFATNDAWTMEVINDQTEVCPKCGSDRLRFTMADGTTEDYGHDVSYCDRCSLSKAQTRNAIPGDLNSAYWCDDCIAEEADEITAMTEIGEEAIAEMVAVKCVACERVITNPMTMARMWTVDTCCPFCGDGALLWDDGSLGFADEVRVAARAVLDRYDAAVVDLADLIADEARDKRIDEARGRIDEMAGDLADALRRVLS